jgi:phosphomannomutase
MATETTDPAAKRARTSSAAPVIFGAGISDELRAAVTQWVQWDRNPDTRQWAIDHAAAGDLAALQQAFGSRLDFGTAGLRGKMAAGPANMNDLVVIQTSQGLARYLKRMHTEFKCGDANLSVVVGYDARHNSDRWAKLISCVCAEAGVHCHLFSEALPTPLVAFAVRRLRAAAGIVVTASHNPPQDNGYKVYWSTGSQIISPHDKCIKQSISESLEPWGDGVWAWEKGAPSSMVSDLTTFMRAEYLRTVSFSPFKELNAMAPAIVYTPMHGVGRSMVQEAMADFGFKAPHIPEEQADPDPCFPTTSFPNPEEAGALDCAIRCAERTGSSLVFANDPDADRLCVAEKQPDGKWHTLTGNELGSLLGWWAFFIRDQSIPAANCVMIFSTVSSHFLKDMAQKEGFAFEETLTGFKWMGTRAAELEAEGKTVLFMFEEAIGFVFGLTGIRDKDGVSSAAICAEMCRYIYASSGTLMSKLTNIFDQYGAHVQNNGYYFCYEKAVIASIFARIRGWDADNSAEFPSDRSPPNQLRYPKAVSRFVVANVRDLNVGYDSSCVGGKPTLPVSASSEMITFTFTNKAVVTLRTSGTEPKIKWYSDIGSETVATAKAELAEMLEVVLSQWLEPEKNGLKPATGT